MPDKKQRVDIWMPLYINEYTGDTMAFTTEQHGAYLLLMMAAWKAKGVLPSDDESIESITKLPPERWQAMKAKVLAKFSIDGATMTQKRITQEMERAQKVSKARSEAGKAGAANLWGKDGKKKVKPKANATANAEQNGEQSDGQNDGKEQSHSPNGEGYISSPFDEAWALYPKRAGGNSQAGARKAWDARIKAGVDPAAMVSGTRRYAAFCTATGKVGTEFVKMAASFYGPQHHYLEAWTPPAIPTTTNRREANIATMNGLGSKQGEQHGTDRTDAIDVQARVIPDVE